MVVDVLFLALVTVFIFVGDTLFSVVVFGLCLWFCFCVLENF